MRRPRNWRLRDHVLVGRLRQRQTHGNDDPDDVPMLAASRSQERFGSYAPSIRAGEQSLHRTPETACMKPESVSLLWSVPLLGEPRRGTETRTSARTSARVTYRGTNILTMSQAAWSSIAPSGISPCSPALFHSVLGRFVSGHINARWAAWLRSVSQLSLLVENDSFSERRRRGCHSAIRHTRR